MILHAVDAELSVLGAAMYVADECADAFDRLRPEHFFDALNAKCWGLICAQHRKGSHIDPVIIDGLLGIDPKKPGGIEWLANLADKANVWALSSHVDLILDRCAKRQIEAMAKQAIASLSDRPAEIVLSDMERTASEIARDSTTTPNAVPVGMTALDNFDAAMRGDFRGCEVGLQCLDHITGGIKQDDVWFVGGRTSMGKSVFGLGIARGIAEQGRGVMMFSLEMPEREVQARLIADIAHHPDAQRQVRYGDILNGRVPMDLRDRARAAAKQIASLPFMVTDRGGLTIEDIRRQALRQIRGWEKAGVQPGAILIDHIGLVQPVFKTDSKAADTADTVNELKGIAKALRCPLICLAQVNRGPEGRNDKRPTMGDLNWSGAIEQIADFVCLLYRESYYLARSGNAEDKDRAFALEHELELLIHKNRSGPICTKKAWIDVACNAVRDVPDYERAYA